ncbi:MULTISPECIES: anti-sigma factor [unclassified Corynebacterium]|uniref:anti-sigma factor family protein n=1 Tax=unclassified Corynebacterium TaxID=2624378 RepID=UPI0035241766
MVEQQPEDGWTPHGGPWRRGNRPREFASVEHLSPEAVAAFVDGELSPGAAHRARVHMVHCVECRDDVDQQRRAAERLRTCGENDDIRVPSSLLERLNSIAQSCPAGPGVEDSVCSPPQTLLDKMDILYRAVRRSRGW